MISKIWTALTTITELNTMDLGITAQTQLHSTKGHQTPLKWTKLNSIALPDLHSLNCTPFPVCSFESWAYTISDSFCQIFLWVITLSATQLDITFRHGCFPPQTNFTHVVLDWRYVLRVCLDSSQSSHVAGLKFFYTASTHYAHNCSIFHSTSQFSFLRK